MSVLDGIDAVVFDVDGTLLHSHDPGGVRGARPIAGAVETVARVRTTGRELLFFTNGTGRPPARYAADLRSVGFELADDEFMNPAVVAARWIARRHPGKSVLVLGGPGVVAPLHDLGIETVAGRADVVLVGWDDALSYAQLRAACESVWAGAPLLATSTAPVFSVNGGPAPGWSGAVAAGYSPDDRREGAHARQAVACGAARDVPRARNGATSHARRRRRPHARDRNGPPGRRAHRARPDGYLAGRRRRSPPCRSTARRRLHLGRRTTVRVVARMPAHGATPSRPGNQDMRTIGLMVVPASQSRNASSI